MSARQEITSLPALVRASCRRVAESSSSVRVATEGVGEYALSLPLGDTSFPEHDPRWHLLGRGEETVAFFLTLDAVNFGSGYFPFLKKREGLSGYFTVASALAERFRAGSPTAQELATLTRQQTAEIFGQDLSVQPVAELMELFRQALSDLGGFLLHRFGGSFTAVVEEAAGSAVRLAEILTEIPFFRDCEEYRGETVHFYKRAQITPQDLALAFGGRGFGSFHDLDTLTIFADNLVPHVLRVDGILQYEPSLAEAIDAGEPIPAGSPQEVELRACAVHAVEMLARALQEAGRRGIPRELDFLLWNRGQGAFYKARPRHRTRTVFY